MLLKCLAGLQDQEQRGFTYSIVVVDNDVNESAREIVELWRKNSAVPVDYHVQPLQNISLARNSALANSRGDLIAFIYDDEFPHRAWLQNLFDALHKFSADGVLGPVIPYYEGTPPTWLPESGLCIRQSFPSGTRLSDPKYMRAGNLLFTREIVDDNEVAFDPNLGRTAGEDADFLDRMARRGRIFVWCNEAIVQEAVPEGRQKASYYIRRAMVRGMTSATPGTLLSTATVRSIVAALIYTASLPVLLLCGRHLFMRYLVKDCDHIAKLLAYCGINLVREKPL